GLAARHEADLLALCLVRNRQRELARMLADLGLVDAPERKSDTREALAIEVIEHVRLILGRIYCGVQLRTVLAGEDARIVAGRELVETKLQHAREHQVEPDERITANTRIRRPALEVVAVKRFDDA